MDIRAPDQDYNPYRIFTREQWARLRDDTPMTLEPGEFERLRSMHDRLDLQEVEHIYLPLSRLLSIYIDATDRLFRAQRQFLAIADRKVPYIIGVAGSVAVGKSTTARVLQALLARWPNVPKVDLITTDGFLYPNAILDREGLRKDEFVRQSQQAVERPASTAVGQQRQQQSCPGQVRGPGIGINEDLDHGRHRQQRRRADPCAQAQHEQDREQMLRPRGQHRRQVGRNQRQRVFGGKQRIGRRLDRQQPFHLGAAR